MAIVNGGEGDDTLNALVPTPGAPVFGTDAASVDIYDGGTGNDAISYIRSLLELFINLQKEFAQGFETGRDIIRNIENVTGGSGDDKIIGNNVANYLSGSSGDDTLIGGLGKDKLEGGLGEDRFVFTSAKETRNNARDEILDFEEGVDKINLRGIDANDNKGANQKFAWVDKDNLGAAFTGEAGDLRLNGDVLMGDTDGDKKADFQILLNTRIEANDIIL